MRRGLDHTEQSQRQRLWCDIGPAEQYWSQMRTFNSYKAWKPTCNTIDEWESTDKAWWPLVVLYHHQQRTEQPCTMPGNDMQDSPWEAFHFKNTMHYWAGIEANTTYVYVSIIHCRVVPQVEMLRALKWGYVAKKLCYIQYICIYALLICFCIGLLVITGASTFSAARYICIEVYCDDTCQEVFSIFCFVNSSEKKKMFEHTHTHIFCTWCSKTKLQSL